VSEPTSVPTLDLRQTSYPKSDETYEETVKFIPLETRDDVLVAQRRRIVYFSDNKIVMAADNGGIFVFDGQGKILSHFNHQGQGPEEYLYLNMNVYGTVTIYDEVTREIFVMEQIGRCQVYSEDGKYLRTFHFPKSKQYREAYSFDRESLLALDKNIDTDSAYVLISKKDGSVLSCIDIPLQKRRADVRKVPLGKWGVTSSRIYTQHLHKEGNDFILSELSSDTIYRFTSDKRLIPILALTPSKQESETPIVFQVFKTTEKCVIGWKYVFDFDTNGIKATPVIYDLEKRQAFGGDNGKGVESFICGITTSMRHNALPANLYILNEFPDRILDWIEKGMLEGKIKEVAEKLDPDDNPVIQVIKVK
jgi:hypothetical protein